MGRQQFYRGDPSLKQYYLVNDFTGGINTTSVDERVETNEFRELLNVELSTKGMLQNRKGWGKSYLLNDLLDEIEVSLPTQVIDGETVPVERYALLKITKNVGNLLALLSDGEEKNINITEFLSYGYTYDLEMAMVYSDVEGIKIGILKISNDPAKNGFTEVALISELGFDSELPLTSLETISYSNFFFFSLSQLNKGLVGFGEFNIDTDKFRFIRDDEIPLEAGTFARPAAFIYKPNPYEATKIGFNVLSQNPLTDISTVATFLGITGVFLTTYNVDPVSAQLIDSEIPIQSIPTDGKFTINALYTGENIDIDSFTLQFFVFKNDTNGIPQESILPFSLKAYKQEPNIGILRFAVEVDVKTHPEIYIRVVGKTGIIFEKKFDRQFATTTALNNYFNAAENTKYVVFSNNEFTLFNKSIVIYTYNKVDEIVYGGDTFPAKILPDEKYDSLTKFIWDTATETEFTQQSDPTLKIVYRTKTGTDAEFDSITEESLNGTSPAFSVNKYKTGTIVQVRKSITSKNTTATLYWTATTNKRFKETITVTSEAFDTFQITDLPDANNYKRNTVIRVYGGTKRKVKYYKVNFAAIGTLAVQVDSPDLEIKYFKVISATVGVNATVITYDKDSSKIFLREEGEEPIELYANVGLVTSVNDIIPQLGQRYLVGTNQNDQTAYYRFNGAGFGNINDFEQITFVETAITVEYVDVYRVGTNPDLKKIIALDTTGFRILEIDARMVLYKENIIWFSDLYQFDYIPNYNYIILPLNPNDNITNIHYFKGSYMIFTKERIYKMSGTFGGQDFRIQIVSDAIGCISPYSVKGFNNTLVFMSSDGLYRIKQNYYQNGLENVEKIDKQIDDITPYNTEIYSLLYNEQYILLYNYADNLPDSGFNVLKMYYNMDAPQGYPFVKDKYSVMPTLISKFDEGLYSIRDGLFYRYDLGYSDFMPKDEDLLTEEQYDEYLYTTKFRSANLMFNYPTHEKKFKGVFIKTQCNSVVPLYFNIYVNDNIIYSYRDFEVVREGEGNLTYNAVDLANLVLQDGDVINVEDEASITVGNPGLIGDFDLNMDKLGEFTNQVHKIVIAGKGKSITIEVEQRLDEYFGIQDIGYLYKMGKAREDR